MQEKETKAAYAPLKLDIPERIKDREKFEETINQSIRRYNPDYWRARQSGLEHAKVVRRQSPAKEAVR